MKTVDHLGRAEACLGAAQFAKTMGMVEEARTWLARCRAHINEHVRARDADVLITPVARGDSDG